MRKVNSYEKFFTRNLFPESTGVIDAFWGYHIANDVGRLLNCDGTVIFEGNPGGWFNRQALIPIGGMSLTSAPIVQLSAIQNVDTRYATFIAVGTPSIGRLINELGVNDISSVWMSTYCQVPGDNWWEEGDEFLGKIGTRTDEVMKFLVNFILIGGKDIGPVYPTGVFNTIDVSLTAERGYSNTTKAPYTEGEALFTLGPNSYYWSETISRTYRYAHSPRYVEAVLTGEVLKIDWLSSSPGTCYFKVYGV